MTEKTSKGKLQRAGAYIPGLLLVGAMSVFSKLADAELGKWVHLEALTIGIVLGMIYANTIGVADRLNAGIRFSLKKLLKAGIVLLGFKLNFMALIELGPKMTLVVVLLVPAVISVSFLLGKWMGIDKKLAVLIGVGSSICGASAVVAMAPTIDARE